MTRCEVCGGKVRRTARTCPHCGLGRLPLTWWQAGAAFFVVVLCVMWLTFVWVLFCVALSCGTA